MSISQQETKEKVTCSYSNNDLSDSDIASLIDGKILLKLRKEEIKTNQLSSMEFNGLKHMSTAFFILFLIITSIVSVSSIPNLMRFKGNKNRMKLNHFPRNLSFYFHNQPSSMKSIMLICQIVFLFLCGCLFNLQKQRMSVPEFQKKKYLTMCFLSFSTLTSILYIMNMYIYDKVYKACATNGYAESIIYFLFALSAYGTCLLSYKILSVLVMNEQYDSYMTFVLNFKKISICVMTVNIIIYTLSILLMKATNGQSTHVTSLLMGLSIANMTLFLILFGLFIFSLRVDIDFIYSLLNFQPDVEFFIDDKDNISIEEEEQL
ncbi:MAG: hypothetical protein MJ252_22610 [archaeon]|nr:hypothetical protein [archaeon]